MIGRAVQEAGKGACNGGQGVLPADVACPPLYAHKNKFQDFIMPMYLSLSMCAQWTVLGGGPATERGRKVAFVVRVCVCVCAGLVFNFLQMFN